MSSLFELDPSRMAGSGIITRGVAGEAIGNRNLIYQGSDGSWYLADADGTPIGAGGQMHLELTFNAGSPNAAYNTAGKSWNLANFDGEEADYVQFDVVTWVVEDGDVGNELLALVAGDKFELFAIYETGADPDGATNATFGSIEVEYV